MEAKMTRKEMILEKLKEMEQKYDELVRLQDGYGYGSLQYKHVCQSTIFYAWLTTLAIALVILLIFQNAQPCLGFILGSTISLLGTIFVRNRKGRKEHQTGQAADIVFCFYTQAMLDEVCAEVESLDARITHRKTYKAEREAKEKQYHEDRLQQAQELQLQFEVLFDIVRKELEGEVRLNPMTETDVSIKLPEITRNSLEFGWHEFPLTEYGLKRLTFQISRLRPAMAEYHSLQKTLDTAVPAEQ